LQRLSGLLAPQLVGRQLSQLVVYQRQQLLGGSYVAGVDPRQDLCDIVHRRPATDSDNAHDSSSSNGESLPTHEAFKTRALANFGLIPPETTNTGK
jgi:hypothetical protein